MNNQTLKSQLEQNPWKTLSSSVVYTNPWISVREDKVIKPNGKEGIYGVVDSKIASGVVALHENNDIVLVGQYRYPMKEYSWEIIEGGTESNESPSDAAKRELMEEAGLEASKITQLGGEIHLSNCHSSERAFVYLAEGLKETSKSPDDTEILQIKTVPFSEALEMVEKGKIKDSMSIIGIYRAARLLSLI
jgi:8-oxo-dGTP pyrophosphatase MutT (NUDIX family)